MAEMQQRRREKLLSPVCARAWGTLRYHPVQSQMYADAMALADAPFEKRDEYVRFPVVVAGRGSGKTEFWRRILIKLLCKKRPWDDPIYFYCLPTFEQARRIGWEKIKPLVPPDWILGHPNESRLLIRTIWGSKLYVVGMDKPHRIEGDQVDGVVLDESSDQKPEAYTKTILPMLQERKGFCARIGVPKRSGVGATDFKKAFDEGLLPNKTGLKGYNWSSFSIRSKEELATLMAQMTEKDAEEQLGGVWVDNEGQVFYAYSDRENVSEHCKYNPDEKIGVGCDFNVTPMAWVIFHYQNGIFRIFDEIFMKETNTQKTLDELNRRYPVHKKGWVFIGDATGASRKTSAASTDYAQIANDLRFVNSELRFPRSNPAILDRFASTNAAMRNANGVRRVFIHPKCEKLRSDLLSRIYKPGTRELPNESGTDIGHITDALGYAIHKLSPLGMILPSQPVNLVG